MRKNAEFILYGARVLVCRPYAKHGHHGDDPLPLYVVQITEANPPAGEKAISWTLLTNEPVQTFEDALAGGQMVRARWIIEEYRRAEKEWLSNHDMQFTTTDVWSQLLPRLSVW